MGSNGLIKVTSRDGSVRYDKPLSEKALAQVLKKANKKLARLKENPEWVSQMEEQHKNSRNTNKIFYD